MLLVANEAGKVAHWLDSHPTLDQRIRRIYGRSMGPLPLGRSEEPPVDAAPDPKERSTDAGDNSPDWTLI
jgi:hypothetical protein